MRNAALRAAASRRSSQYEKFLFGLVALINDYLGQLKKKEQNVIQLHSMYTRILLGNHLGFSVPLRASRVRVYTTVANALTSKARSNPIDQPSADFSINNFQKKGK